MGHGQQVDALPFMRVQGVIDGGHHLSGDTKAVVDVVPCDLVGCEPEERGKCEGHPEDTGVGQLSDGLDVAP